LSATEFGLKRVVALGWWVAVEGRVKIVDTERSSAARRK
jgi:hypothetical protein